MSNLSLEYQVCSLEQAKELAKLLGEHTPGSLYVWVNYDEDYYDDPLYWNVYSLEYDIECDNCSVDYRMGSYIPAYTGDELGALLPMYINMLDGSKYSYYSFRHLSDSSFCCGYYDRNLISICTYNIENNGILKSKAQELWVNNNNEAHAKAALAIKGLKEGWIRPEEFKYE